MKSRSQSYQSVASDRIEPSSIIDHMGLVHRIAWHMHSRMPAHVVIEDIVQAGMVGLIEAFKSFDFNRDTNFQTWAGIRIRGAILDEVRRGDWVPRSVYKKRRLISNAVDTLSRQLGRQPTEQEIASELAISIDEYHQWLLDQQGVHLLAMESDGEVSPFVGDGDSPQTSVEDVDVRAKIVEAISNLDEKEKLLLSLYYEQELTFKEVGAVLGVSESRVSQLHNQSVIRIRSMLGDGLVPD